MPRLREIIDFRWTDGGDLFLDPDDGDLLDTKDENYQGAIQRVTDRINSSRGDWAHAPSMGATLSRFAGKPNTPETGDRIRQAVVNELVRGNFLSPQEFEVQVFPISKQSVAVFINIAPLGQRETIQLVASYNLTDNKVSLRN